MCCLSGIPSSVRNWSIFQWNYTFYELRKHECTLQHSVTVMTYMTDGEFWLPGENAGTGLRPTPRLFTDDTDSGVRCRFLEAAFDTVT